MSKISVTLLCVFIFSFHSLTAQKGCPQLVVMPDLMEPGIGKPVNFMVFPTSYKSEWTSLDGHTIKWAVNNGSILSGQGSNLISVSTEGLSLNSTVTAFVEIGGLPSSCNALASSTVTIKNQAAYPAWNAINICMLDAGKLTTINGYYNSGYGDTIVIKDNKRSMFRAVYKNLTEGYAATRSWYIESKPITYLKHKYVKYGLPRILGANEIDKTGEIQGVPVFVEKGIPGTAEVIYIPVRYGCEFQPYQKQVN